MFRENSKHYENAKSVKRITSTVDTMVENSHLKNERIDLIKADVQGAELEVFKGARRALSQATFVYFEGSTVEYNEGGSCLHEVDAFLRSQGFFLYDYDDKNYNKAFKTLGLGQFDGKPEYCFPSPIGRPIVGTSAILNLLFSVMYVRPDSDRLPQYLANSGVKFCGYGRNTVTTDSTSPATASMDALSMQGENSCSLWKEIGFVEGWVSGFLMGIVVCMLIATFARKRDAKYISPCWFLP
jgi:hypothetical protein